MRIVEENKFLAVVEDCNKETPLQVLARKPGVFSITSSKYLIKIDHLIYIIIAPLFIYLIINNIYLEIICLN